MPPRPRPRPRPRPQPARSSSAHPDAASSSAREQSKEEEDEDALFMRNRGRSLKEVNKRVAQAAAIALQTSSPTGSDEDDVDEDTPKLGKTRKQNTLGKSNALPKWTKKGGMLNLLGLSDSESENNDPSTYEGTPSKRRRAGTAGTTSTTGTPTKRCKRARSRSRSRSLTPPPDLTLAQKIFAQQAIQNALRSENMLPSSKPVIVVEDDDDGDDAGGVELDPALQHIAQAVLLERDAKRKGRDNFGSSQAESSRVSHHGSSGRPQNVTVRVKWVPYPQPELMHARVQQTWSFTVNRHHSLKELHMQTSLRAHVHPEDLVLMRDSKRIFTSVSPDGLGAWDEVDLEACDRKTFEALRAQHFRSPTPALMPSDDAEVDRECSAAPSEASADPGDSQSKIKLVLRAQGSKEVALTVRPTTSCGKVIRAFLAIIAKHGGTVPVSPRKAARVHLCIDGEKQDHDTPISDCDLEDGDMVEVVGL